MPREFEPSNFDEYAEFKRKYPKDVPFLDKLLLLAVNDEIPWRLVHTFLVGTLSLDHFTPDSSIAETLGLWPQDVSAHIEELFENPRLYAAWERMKETQQKNKPERVRPSRSQSARPSGVIPSTPRVVPLKNVERYTGPIIKRKKQPERFDPTKSFFAQRGNGEPKKED